MILPPLVFPAMLLHSKPVVMKLAALDAYGVKLVSYIASFHSLKKPFHPSLSLTNKSDYGHVAPLKSQNNRTTRIRYL